MNPRALIFSLSLIYLFQFAALRENDSAPQPADKPYKYDVKKDVEWVSIDTLSLTMDIYTPANVNELRPVLVIFHGGAWLINDNSVMDSMSIYMAEHTNYLICNVNYRLLSDFSNTVLFNQIIEDAMGAVLEIIGIFIILQAVCWLETLFKDQGNQAGAATSPKPAARPAPKSPPRFEILHPDGRTE